MSEDVSELVARLDDERYAAMLAGDVAALDRLLDARLRYVHSSGGVDTKASYLAAVAEGRVAYRAIKREEQAIVPLDGTALVFNRLSIDVVVAGTPKLLEARALAVWHRTEGAWRLVAVLSGAVPAA